MIPTCASEVMQCQGADCLILKMPWLHASRRVGVKALVSKPVREPAHVAVAYEWVGHEVEGFEVVERVESSRSNATDLV